MSLHAAQHMMAHMLILLVTCFQIHLLDVLYRWREIKSSPWGKNLNVLNLLAQVTLCTSKRWFYLIVVKRGTDVQLSCNILPSCISFGLNGRWNQVSLFLPSFQQSLPLKYGSAGILSAGPERVVQRELLDSQVQDPAWSWFTSLCGTPSKQLALSQCLQRAQLPL